MDKRRILLSVFMASFASTLLQRGIYFFMHDVLGFSQAQNLWVALLVGITYIFGATSSHKLTVRFGERKILLTVLVVLATAHAALACFPRNSALLVPLFALIVTVQGTMWPIFESYMSAGETPKTLGRALGRYNISWALSVPVSLAVAGPLIASGQPASLFAAAAALNALVALSCVTYPAQPSHLDAGHAERPDAQKLGRYRSLLAAARFAMLGSYALMYVIAPLMPEIMKSIGFNVAAAARASSLLDVARLAAFIALFTYSGWHGRATPVLLAICALPAGFALVLFGSSVATVVPGELLFGAAAGFLYTAALYYAQVVENASVDAGGAHEALIGLGYAVGPAAGLIGSAIASGAGPGSAAYVHGMSIATLPVVLGSTLAALWPLLKSRKSMSS
ncbi:MAG: MFS transporter [Pseudomonadota bacterium]